MLSFKTCEKVPELGGRGWYGGGGLVEVEGRVVWGRGEVLGGVYMYEEDRWSRVAGGGENGGTLAVCGGRLVWVGGYKGGVSSKEVEGVERREMVRHARHVGRVLEVLWYGGDGRDR